MKRHAVRLSVSLLLACIGGSLVLLATLPLRSVANLLPESAIMVHPQPVAGTCLTPIVLCDDIVNNTDASGPVEFLIFFEPITWQESGDQLEILGLHTELIWPDTWELVDFDPCWGEGELNSSGPPYALDVSWMSVDLPMGHHEVFLVARLVLNVKGQGWLDFLSSYDNPVEMGDGGDVIVSLAHASPAQAGVECGYTRYDCGHGPLCALILADTELHLNAPPGGAAAGGTLLTLNGNCQLTVEPGAAWIRVRLEEINWYQERLIVTALATGLAPGTYEARVQASSPLWCTVCLKVVFRVGDPTPALETTWSAIKARYN